MDVIDRARGGDEAAWAQLYADHGRRLVVWLQTLPRGDAAHSAEDIAADAWLAAAQKLDGFVGDEDGFAGWLFTIARNISLNHRRTSQRRRTSPVAVEGVGADSWGVVADQTTAVDGQHRIRHLLSLLSEREAQVVACVDVVGFDARTTGEVLGISAVAVRVARHRGLGRLRHILEAEEATGHDEAAGSPLTAVGPPSKSGCNNPPTSRHVTPVKVVPSSASQSPRERHLEPRTWRRPRPGRTTREEIPS